jgi:hypothetical protein
MTDLRTAAQQALEALERGAIRFEAPIFYTQAIAALKAALEQPEQDVPETDCGNIEPVAVCEYCEKERPVIHAPRREWRGLSKEEREAAIKWAIDLENTQFSRTVARAIEAKLKELNHE